MIFNRKVKIMYQLAVFLVLVALHQVATINLNRHGELKKEEFLELDREVTEYFVNSYEALDNKNITFDKQLLTALRSHRHTIMLNHYDYRYDNYELMRQSAGAKVDENLCKQQLAALVKMSQLDDQLKPLSAINFFESNGRTPAAVLNGNFVWLGSYDTCKRAKIPSHLAKNYLASGANETDIVGRYCVAHIRSKSWPIWDKYFEERLRIRVAVCLPETCHSNLHEESEEIRRDADFLARNNLLNPYNSDGYTTDYLYCLPDDDSPFRQWDTGTKLLAAFTCLWVLILLYTNVKYHKRLATLRELRQSVDIRMIISQRRESTTGEGDKLDTDEEKDLGESKAKAGGQQMSKLEVIGSNSAGSAQQTPIASEIEDNDGEFKPIRSVVLNRKKKNSKSKQSSGIDFVKAFSIQSNLAYLLKRRSSEIEARVKDAKLNQQVLVNQKRLSQQLNAVSRRTSASNEALIKDLQQDEEANGDGQPKVSIVSADEVAHNAQERGSSGKRINMDLFDGIKVFSTFYIVHGHTLMFFFGVITDIRFADERMLDFVLISAFNTLHVVSLFYIMTGALLTYLAFSQRRLKDLLRPSFWILAIASRYLRLLPSYLLVFWFVRHAAVQFGSGPLWFDYRTDSEHVRGFCATESWTTMLTMSSADIKIPYDCVPQSWYLSNDFRTLLILPFYIMLLAKNRTAGYAAILATLVFSWARLTSILRRANIDYIVLAQWKPHVYTIGADRLHEVYTDLFVRLGTFLVGVATGHLLYLYETREIKEWPKWFKNIGIKVNLISATLFFFGGPLLANPYINQFLPDPKDYDSDGLAILVPLFKVAMEINLGFILLLLVTGGGYSIINRLLSSNIAKIMANISYGVFLIHVEIMYKIKIQQIESSYWSLYVHSIFIIVVSNIVAFIIHLLYEMPINNLIRYIVSKIKKTFQE